MKLISDHIRLLLHDHDCVVIPGLGGFIQNRFGASFDRTENKFYSHRNVPLFNKQLQSNDGLLAAALVKSQSYSYADALKEIQRFVDQVKESQVEKRPYPLSGLGVFETNHEGQLAFFPDKNCNVSKHSYGLAPLALHPISRNNKKQRPALAPIRKRSKRWIATMSFILFLSVSAWLVKDHSDFQNVQWSAINPFSELWEKPSEPITGENVGTMESIITEPEINQEELTDSIQEAPTEETENQEFPLVEAPVVETHSADSVYYIVVGAFQVEKNALSYSKELQTKGYPSGTYAEGNSPLVRVTAETHSNRLSAEKRLTKIQNEINRGAWILATSKKTS